VKAIIQDAVYGPHGVGELNHGKAGWKYRSRHGWANSWCSVLCCIGPIHRARVQ